MLIVLIGFYRVLGVDHGTEFGEALTRPSPLLFACLVLRGNSLLNGLNSSAHMAFAALFEPCYCQQVGAWRGGAWRRGVAAQQRRWRCNLGMILQSAGAGSDRVYM
jgi:hypothetical protein